jgi:TM2 domain-containing membrane protein YozV
MQAVGEWYYIGHYGQLGPLTREQLDELIDGEVIARDTYVWRVGMSEWIAAGQCNDLVTRFKTQVPVFDPPPPPAPAPIQGPAVEAEVVRSQVYAQYPRAQYTVQSDRNRILAGILQIFIPGVGRMYLGYGALGVVQLLSILCGVGAIWGLIDGILILCGSVKLDGFGRQMK